MGSLEAWLLLRSLRTLHLRVPRQSTSATTLAQWLDAISTTPVGKTYDDVPGGVLAKVWHSSLQAKDARGFEPKQQMEGGWNATFAIQVRTPRFLFRSITNTISLSSLNQSMPCISPTSCSIL